MLAVPDMANTRRLYVNESGRTAEQNRHDLSAILGMSKAQMAQVLKEGPTLTARFEESVTPRGSSPAQLRPLTTFLDEGDAGNAQLFADSVLVGLLAVLKCLRDRSMAMSGLRIPAHAISFRPGASTNLIARYSEPRQLYKAIGDGVLLGIVMPGDRIRVRNAKDKCVERIARLAAQKCGMQTDASTLEWDGNLPRFTSQHLDINVGARDRTLAVTSPEDMYTARAVLAAKFREGDDSRANLFHLGSCTPPP